MFRLQHDMHSRGPDATTDDFVYRACLNGPLRLIDHIFKTHQSKGTLYHERPEYVHYILKCTTVADFRSSTDANSN